MGWGDMWQAVEGAMSSGVNDVGRFFGVGDTAQQAGQVAAGTVPDTPAMTGQGMTASNPQAAGLTASNPQAAGMTKSSWWEKGIEQMMPAIMGATLRPKQQRQAPVAPGGHGITASGSTAMQPFQEVTKMADDNPLAGIHQWSNLFG